MKAFAFQFDIKSG